MAEDDNILYGDICSIYHEIRQSFYYMFSAYSILDGKVPNTAKVLLDEIGKIYVWKLTLPLQILTITQQSPHQI